MRRVLQFFAWQRAQWEERAKECIGECAADVEGLQAYAARQAYIRHRLADHFHVLWSPFFSPEGPGGFVINNSPPEDSLPDLMIPDVPDY